MQFISPNQKRLSRISIRLLCLLFSTMLGATTAFANSEASPSEHGEVGGGEQNSSGSEHGASAAGGGSDREWAKRKSKLNIYEAKIAELQKKIREMIAKKNANQQILDEKDHAVDPLKGIAGLHAELKKNYQMYKKEMLELNYRYPEQGALIERNYLPLRPKTLEQFESEVGIEAELTQTKKKIDKKYSSFTDANLKVQAPPPPKPEETLKDKPARTEEPQKLKLTK